MNAPKRIKSLRKQFPISDGKTVVYIAGKVTGLPWRAAYLKFKTRELELEKEGYTVINPMELCDRSCDWQEAMRICLSFLPHADVIDLLPDWEDSKGAMMEAEIAQRLGIKTLGV